MMPGSIYLGLVAGQTMGPAAEWTTIILFTEVARRSLTTLTRQEVYVLYYIAGGLTAMTGGFGAFWWAVCRAHLELVFARRSPRRGWESKSPTGSRHQPIRRQSASGLLSTVTGDRRL